MKKYSYLNIPHTLESNYRQLQTYTTDRDEWSVYKCMRTDCIDSEKYVAVKKYTKDRLTADSFESVISNIHSFIF